MTSVRSMTSTTSAAPSNFAGADAWVNGPYMTDTHALWAEIEAAAPPPRPRRRPESTPRERSPLRRALTERVQSGGDGDEKDPKATGDKASPQSSQAGEDGPPKPVIGRPSPYGQAHLKKAAAAAAAEEGGVNSGKVKRNASPKGGSGKGKKGKNSDRKGKTARARSASPAKRRPGTDRTDGAGRIVQPKWNGTGPPRRAPGEVINKYNHQGLMEETFEALHRGPGGSPEALQLTAGGGMDSSAAGFSTVSAATTEAGAASRLSRVTTSPSTRCHPNQDRRNELRGADMFSNINYFATSRVPNAVSRVGDAVYGAPDNDRRMKEASWISSQAWFESLRYYPKGREAADNDDCEATFSGNTHGSKVPAEHLENDVRNRVGIAAADPGWTPAQLIEPWAPDMEARMRALKMTTAKKM